MLGVGILSAVETLPYNAVKSEEVGYFPTYEESGILATDDYDYLRSNGGALTGNDLDRWASTGAIWPYEVKTGDLHSIQRSLRPVDYILRPLTPGETLVVQGPLSESWFELGASFPFLSRTYHEEKSTFAEIFGMGATQYSPFFFDLLSISARAAWIDTSGDGWRNTGLDDNSFLSSLSIDIRAGWRLTDRTTILVAGQVYFVFSEDAEVQYYLDAGGLTSFANLNYQVELGSWDIHVFDNLLPISTRRILYEETLNGGQQRAGYYYEGIPDSLDTGDWWDSRNQYMINTAGVTAGTFVGSSLRFLAGFARMDTWQWDDFDNHVGTEYSSAGLFYDAYDWWIAPSLTYTVATHDFGNAQHLLTLNATAPLSPNITAYGSFGYSWGEAHDGEYYSLGLNYNQTSRLSHSLTYTSGYQAALFGNDFMGHRLGYNVTYLLGSRIALGAYANSFFGAENQGDAQLIGVTGSAALGNYSNLAVNCGWLNKDYTDGTSDGDQWYYSVTLSHQLATRLHGQLAYEYFNSFAYAQSLISLRVTRSF